jgi:hypothetical protein
MKATAFVRSDPGIHSATGFFKVFPQLSIMKNRLVQDIAAPDDPRSVSEGVKIREISHDNYMFHLKFTRVSQVCSEV